MRSNEEALAAMDEATKGQGDDLEGEYNAERAKLEQEAWEARAERKLQKQIQKSINDSEKVHEANGITTPKGVAVIVSGVFQSAGEGGSGLVKKAAELRKEGYIVIEVKASTLAQINHSTEPDANRIEILREAVQVIAQQAVPNAPIDITGYSWGSSGANQLTNSLTRAGMEGGRIHLDVDDPYMGRGSTRINDPRVRISVERSGGFHLQNFFVNLGARLWGIHNRDVFQGKSTEPLPFVPFDLGHTQMDQCMGDGGALQGCGR